MLAITILDYTLSIITAILGGAVIGVLLLYALIVLGVRRGDFD